MSLVCSRASKPKVPQSEVTLLSCTARRSYVICNSSTLDGTPQRIIGRSITGDDSRNAPRGEINYVNYRLGYYNVETATCLLKLGKFRFQDGMFQRFFRRI